MPCMQARSLPRSDEEITQEAVAAEPRAEAVAVDFAAADLPVVVELAERQVAAVAVPQAAPPASPLEMEQESAPGRAAGQLAQT